MPIYCWDWNSRRAKDPLNKSRSHPSHRGCGKIGAYGVALLGIVVPAKTGVRAPCMIIPILTATCSAGICSAVPKRGSCNGESALLGHSPPYSAPIPGETKNRIPVKHDMNDH